MIFEAIIIDNSGMPVLTWRNEDRKTSGLTRTDPLIVSGLLVSLEQFSGEFFHEPFQEFYLESSKILLVNREKDGYRLISAIRCSLDDSSRLIKKRAVQFLDIARSVRRSSDGLIDSSQLGSAENLVSRIANSRVYTPGSWKTLTGLIMVVMTLLYAALAYAYRYPASVSNGELIFTSITLPVMLVPGFVMGGKNPFRTAVLLAAVSFVFSFLAIWLVETLDTLTNLFASFDNTASIVLLFTALGFTGGSLGSHVNRLLFLVGSPPAGNGN